MTSKYKSTFGRLIGELKMCEVRNLHIQDCINKLAEEGRATSSIREALGTLRRCFESARNNQIINSNPCFEVKVPWENKTVLRRFLTREEQQEFLKEVEYDWYKEMYYTMLLTGLRIGEVGGLMWKDIDFKNKCINVNQSLSCNYAEGVKTMVIGTLKTANSYRKIPFIGEVEEILKEQKKKQDALRKSLGKRYRAEGEFSDLVFTSSMGSPVTRYIAEKQIKKVVNAINTRRLFEAQIEGKDFEEYQPVYPHALRHTFCSRCFEKGLKPKVVQMLMGHANYSTTIEIYTHVTDHHIEEEVAKMDNAYYEDVRKAYED